MADYDGTKLVRLKHLVPLANIVKENKDDIEVIQQIVGDESIPEQIQSAVDELIGDPSDDTSLDTLNSVRNLANSKVASVSAGDNSLAVGGTPTAPTISIKISEVAGNNLTVEDDGLYVSVPSASEYTIAKKSTANQGYAASYQLTKDGVAVGVDIDIPKDFLVKSGSVEEVTVADEPYDGAVVGDKYLDFVINTIGDDETAQHIYIPVNDLVDAYTAGNGISISNTNEISLAIDSTNANGLSVGQDGLVLNTASDTNSGAMSSSDFSKLAGMSANANSVSVPSTWDGTVLIDDAPSTVVEIATDAEVDAMLAEVFPA